MDSRPLMKFRHLLLAFLCLASSLHAQFIISEFLASNSNSIIDEDGNHSDWIEINNTGASAANLLGWYVSDDSSQPRKWAFPSVTVSGGGYLVIFASGKNRTNPAANLHTNFKLSSSPSYLGLAQDIARRWRAGGAVSITRIRNGGHGCQLRFVDHDDHDAAGRKRSHREDADSLGGQRRQRARYNAGRVATNHSPIPHGRRVRPRWASTIQACRLPPPV